MKVVDAGMFVLTDPLVCVPLDRSVTRQPMELPFCGQYKINSYRSVVLTGKLAPKAVTVGAVPVTLFTKFQFPVLALIAMPILPGVVLVVGSTFVGAVVTSAMPTNARLPDANVSVPKRIV